MDNNLSAIVPKVPAPNFSDEKPKSEETKTTQTKPKRKFNMPNVGVVSAPNISRNPLGDTLRLKKQQTPKMAYLDNSKQKNKKNLSFFNITTIGTILFGLLALFSQGHKIKKFFKK